MKLINLFIVSYIFIFYFFDLQAFGERKAAYFQTGKTFIVKNFKVGLKGKTIKISQINTPIDNVMIEIPPGSLEKENEFSIGYNTGKVILNSGISSNIVLVFKSKYNYIAFKKPILLTIPYNVKFKPVGYVINESGSLSVLGMSAIDKKNGLVSFYSFKPLMMTLVYIN